MKRHESKPPARVVEKAAPIVEKIIPVIVEKSASIATSTSPGSITTHETQTSPTSLVSTSIQTPAPGVATQATSPIIPTPASSQEIPPFQRWLDAVPAGIKEADKHYHEKRHYSRGKDNGMSSLFLWRSSPEGN
jgi:hypothetical protein